MMLGSLTNAIIFEVRWFLRWFLRCPGPKKKPNPLFALAPPVYNTLPDAETIVNTWAEMTKFAATAIGMLLATYCLYWLIQQICTLSYRLGIAVAVGASDDTSRHRKRLLMMTSCQLSPMPSESHLELYTAKSSSSTSVASESKKKKSNNQCNSDPNRSPILENAASPNTSSLLDDGTEVS
ncbi:hypothetical protein WR25_20212 [Diploscapter pachys]|uniref:Uncharacterized protein n=1 Tax=Diploscapter pachys TaxID=2018661 RepID=A0A2A2M1M5_9BILA|nr:hypothetical protein WR25_20212 [Diploscapter pachys]